jgi:Amt family ammonium transporter
VPYVLLGPGLLWFGWFGFNAGSALAANASAVLAFACTNTASATAALTWVFLDAMLGRKISALGFSIGAVVGLVAITPAAGYVSIGASLCIGVAASMVSNLAVSWRAQSSIDDTLDVFSCHGLGGIVGMLATAVFAKDVGLIFGQTGTFIAHFLGLVIVVLFTFGGSLALYWLTGRIIRLRVKEEQELMGLDLSQHAESIIQASLSQDLDTRPAKMQRTPEPVQAG